jgi:hypothetical protein
MTGKEHTMNLSSTRLYSRRSPPFRTMFSALLVLVAALHTASWAQQFDPQDAALDPPGRVARLNLAEGAVSFAPAEAAGYSASNAWTPALLNRPLTRGDRLWTGPRARSELHIGSSALRMNEATSLDFLALDDNTTQLRLAQGTIQLRVRALFEGQRLEIDTPNLAFVIYQPGNYRLDVNPASDTTRVVAQSGSGMIYGDNGVSLMLGSQQQGTFSGTQLAPAAPGAAVQDRFDLWAADRDRREDQSISARYVPRETIGYQQLDSYGDWQQDPAYGAVWLPRAVPVNWAPYRAGHWDWISPWGWTWVDDAPWGFAPFHYGRWAQIGPRWAWVPGQLPPRPVYAPALVAFVGGSNWSLAIGSGAAPRPALGWFPLAPGEAFRPAYRASPRYVSRVNNIVNNTVNVTNIYRYQRQPAAVTAASRDDFARGPLMQGRLHALSAADLSRAQVLADRSAMPQRQERPDLRERPRLAPAALPPPAVAAQAVVRSQGERGHDGQPFPNLPNRADERPNDPRASRLERSDRTPRLQSPPPAAPAAAVQPPAVRPLPVPAPERSAPEAEQRVRREQQTQPSELIRQQDQQRLLREQAQRQQELVRQQAQEQQRRQGEEALGQQRVMREQAQQAQRQQAQQQQQQRRQNEPLREQRPGNGGTPPLAPDARAAAERNAVEQAQRAQLQREQQRQQMELTRQQEQQRRQGEEALSQQRAMREQAQQQRASQQEAQRQAHEQQTQQQDQRRQQAQERQQARPAAVGNPRAPRPEGEPPGKQEP